MLFIGAAIFPVVNSTENNGNSLISNEVNNNDCCCESNHIYGMEHSKKRTTNVLPGPWINGVPDSFSWKDFGGQDWTTSAKNQYSPKAVSYTHLRAHET